MIVLKSNGVKVTAVILFLKNNHCSKSSIITMICEYENEYTKIRLSSSLSHLNNVEIFTRSILSDYFCMANKIKPKPHNS